MSKINLLIELDTFDKGGLQKVVLDSALRLDRSRFEVTIVSIGATGYLADVARAQGIKVYGLSSDGDREAQYRHIIEERGINLSNSHFSRFGYPILREYSIPNITFIHNVYAFLWGPALKNFVEDDRYVDRYISVSNNATRYASARLGISPGKIVTIPNGLILEEHEGRRAAAGQLRREDFGLAETDYVFLNVASYNLHKGHYLMADAMKKILATRRDVKILCIGNVIVAHHVESFMAYLREEGLDSHILMPGYYPNVEDFFAITDAFLLPSFIEGWSIAMNEAMFYEKPMILTDTGASAEVIEDNDIGILIENEYGDITELGPELLDELAYKQRRFRTSDRLAIAMMDFADNREHWREAGRKGRTKILERYDFDRTVKEYERIFAGMAGGEGVPRKPQKPVCCEEGLIRRFAKGLAFYLANHLFMNQPSYRLRHWFLRKALGIEIGPESSIHMGCFVTGNQISVGHNTVINRGTYLDGRAGLRIGNNVNVSHQSLIQTLTHDPQNPDFVCMVSPVEIGDHAWIGTRAIILPGVRIGEGAVVGAGAVVSKDVPPYAIVVGNPARIVRQRNRLIRYRSRYFPFFDSDIQ